MRLTKKIIESHIDFLQRFLRSNKFGVIMDINYRGILLKKKVSQNGTFFEIPLYPPFDKYPNGDLHLSVFEDSGIITKHVTFKTKINGNPVSFYYGKRYRKIDGKMDFEDYKPKKWTSPPKEKYPFDILQGLKDLYNNIKPDIKIQYELESGKLSSPRTLPTWGEGSTRKNLSNEAKQAAREFYADYGSIPPSPLRKVLGEVDGNALNMNNLTISSSPGPKKKLTY
jgi:hypothetical protein